MLFLGQKQSFNTSETFRVFIDLFAFLSLISRFPDASEGCKIQVTHTQVNFVLLFFMVRPSPFFFFVYRRMRFLILGRSVGLNKKNLKKITRSLRIVGPGTPGRR